MKPPQQEAAMASNFQPKWGKAAGEKKKRGNKKGAKPN